MRTNVVIDDELMESALKASGKKTRKDLIEEGLRLLIEMKGHQTPPSLQSEKKAVKDPAPSAGDEGVSAEMGMRIKEARESRGFSLFDVYLRTDVKVDLLAQIEEGKVTPPLGTVIKLAKALDLKIGYFISGKEKLAYTIVHRGDREPTSRYDPKKEKRYGYEYESLAPHKMDRLMEPFLITLKPSETEEERSTHDGQEFIFVLQGKMEVRLGEDIHILEPGDSIYYDAALPHLVKCRGGEATKILAVLHAGK
jgi:transcriptional regulator with XRE-family HTH domain/Arc/MetJ family transcription regulator